jgi:choline dehydrogenase
MYRLSFSIASFSPALGSVLSQLSGGQLTDNSFGTAGLNATYDYVIVGRGQAGAVVAARLTEHTNASVALVEAGSFYELSNGNWSQLPYCKSFNGPWEASHILTTARVSEMGRPAEQRLAAAG